MSECVVVPINAGNVTHDTINIVMRKAVENSALVPFTSTKIDLEAFIHLDRKIHYNIYIQRSRTIYDFDPDRIPIFRYISSILYKILLFYNCFWYISQYYHMFKTR